MALQKLVAPSRRLLEHGFGDSDYKNSGYRTFESNIDFEVSLMLLKFLLLSVLLNLYYTQNSFNAGLVQSQRDILI